MAAVFFCRKSDPGYAGKTGKRFFSVILCICPSFLLEPANQACKMEKETNTFHYCTQKSFKHCSQQFKGFLGQPEHFLYKA